ncbi:hypothetical protein PV05_08272 [Exophiala xenobiotica]|uniref:Uncharacterized protein n=1 Tax=Exophiala xenobiotica TaxID=348802 RepID=A0A0D2BJM0_9EURO|nr:uncharacterized protein PV05_08272 [Exophiala xenobiotica]KIW52646.1 hypothetical protein PV05_08272 [Exophiala xenobiotica]
MTDALRALLKQNLITLGRLDEHRAMFSHSPAQSSPFIATNRPHHFHCYTPVTPSPLRTSRNANLMPASPGHGPSSPIIASSPLGKFAVSEEQDENVTPSAFFGRTVNGNDGAIEGFSGVQKTQFDLLSRYRGGTGGAGMQKTPESPKQYPNMNGSVGGSALVTPPDSTSSNSALNADRDGRVSGTTQSRFLFGNEKATANSASFTFIGGQNEKKEGIWESRARSASPAAAIARHAAQGREKKKSQFLDRIRRRRDDARSEGVGDQVLRMDFVRERRVWEDEMRRRALAEGDADVLEDEVMSEWADSEGEEGHEEMSPTEEYDPEAEELGIYYDYEIGTDPGTHAQGRGSSRTGPADGEDFIVDEDEEYEEVFREFILRDQGQGQGQHRESVPQQQMEGHTHGQQSRHGEYEAGMDLS